MKDHLSTRSSIPVLPAPSVLVAHHSSPRHLDLSYRHPLFQSGNDRMTPSKDISATAFAGNARKKHGTKPLQYPLAPSLRQIATAASRHRGNIRGASPTPLPPTLFRLGPSPSVMMRCLTTSEGYEVSQNTCAERPPAQKLIDGVERFVLVERSRVKRS